VHTLPRDHNLDNEHNRPYEVRERSQKGDCRGPRVMRDAAAALIQGLMHHFRPEVETQIRNFRAKEGGVIFGGRMTAGVDPSLALPDDLEA
jgi:hypothetical protein